MKTTRLALLALLCLQQLCLGPAHSADPDTKLEAERLKQEMIFQSKDQRVLENYTIGRSLLEYADGLPPDFDTALANLGPKDRWMDIGAGQGRAILDYYTQDYDLRYPASQDRRGKKAQTVAISIEDRRTPLWHQTAARLEANQIRYLFDKRFRDYTLSELGKFQIITDLLGGFSYTENMSLLMERTLGFLEVNGTFYTLLQDVNSEAGSNPPYYANSPYLTQIESANKAEVKVCSWLKRISCVEVTCELNNRWKPPVEAYRIRKVCNEVSVPALTGTHFEAGTPPERRYSLDN